MPRKIKCSVDSCQNWRRDDILHKFPVREKRLNLWLKSLIGVSDISNIRPGISVICNKHFERRFVTSKFNLQCGAYPTLFTSDEITSGQPSEVKPPDYVSSDHAYNRQRHEDHNYSKTPFSATNESPAEKRLSDDEDKIGNSKKNQSCSGQDHPANNCGFKSSIDPGSNKTRGEPNNFEDGIDLNSLDGFDEPPTEAIFSWQKEDILYPADDTDVLMCPEPAKGDQLRQLLEDVSLYEDKPTQPSQTHEKTRERADAEYQCNVCEKEIIGFRYTCVQCADFDLCGACEANGAHNTHYVLRVPKDRPYNEIQTVLAAIRQQLLAENLFLTEQMIEDSVKSEPEEEPGEGVERGWEHAPAQAEPDPLRRPTPDLAREAPAPIRSDDEYSDGSVYRPPRRKRRRRRSLNTNSDTDSDTDSSDTTHTDTPHYKARTKPATRSALNPVHGTQLVTHPKVGQPDVLEISGAVYQLPDDIFAVPGTVFEVAGNIYEVPASMAADGILEVPDNITVFRQEPSKVITERIYVEEDVVQDNFDTDNRILHLRVPPNTDDAALAQALYSQASVALQPLVIRTMKR